MIKNLANDELLAKRVRRANSFTKRLLGLMFTKFYPTDFDVLLFSPCNGIHTMFMWYPIDVIFLDKDLKVLHMCHQMKPRRISPIIKGSHLVLEVKAGMASSWGLDVGDQLYIN